MATKKKVKPVEEEKIETPETETPIDQPEITDPVSEEQPTEEIPPSVTLDEVQEVEKETPIEETKDEAQPLFNTQNINDRLAELEEEKTMADKILSFVESKSGEIKLNDFIRSTYPPVTFAEPAKYFHQQESRVIRAALEGLVKEGKIVIKNNAHLTLGDFYHEGEDQRTKHHNLNSVEIIAVK